MDKKNGAARAAAIAVVLASLAFVYWPERPFDWSSELCSRLSASYGMTCTRVLAAEGVFAPGSITRLEAGDGATERAELPSSTLLSDTCLLPGSSLNVFHDIPVQETRIGGLDIEDRSARKLTKASLTALPKIADLSIEAGPAWASVRRVEFHIPGGWIRTLDEQRLADSIGNCYVRPDCIDRIRSLKDRVVNSTLVAESISYKFFDRDDREVTIGLGTEADAVNIDLGGKPYRQEKSGGAYTAPFPVVVAVTFVRDAIIAATKPCTASVFYTPRAEGWIAVGGGGKSGAIAAPQKAYVKFDQAKQQLDASGRERSECNAGEQNTSHASVTAKFSRIADNKVGIAVELEAQGGHYRTVDRCLFGKGIGFHGEDNVSTASSDVTAAVEVGVRDSAQKHLTIAWTDFIPGPTAQTRLTVSDGSGSLLIEGEPLEGTGDRTIPIREAGVYTVRTSTSIQATATGQGRQKISSTATLGVTVE